MVLVYFSGRGRWYIDGEPAFQRDKDLFDELGYIFNQYCSKTAGVFKLSEKEENQYQTLKDLGKGSKEALSVIKTSINRLLPSDQKGSAFLDLVEQGKLSLNDIEKCSFFIQTEHEVKKKWVPIEYELTLIEPIKNKSKNETISHHPNRSDNLVWLIQASEKFWANADRDDKTTWHNKAEIASWLVSKGYSESLAKHAATIISPNWLESGRKPEK